MSERWTDHLPTIVILGALHEVQRNGGRSSFMTPTDIEQAWAELERRAVETEKVVEAARKVAAVVSAHEGRLAYVNEEGQLGAVVLSGELRAALEDYAKGGASE